MKIIYMIKVYLEYLRKRNEIIEFQCQGYNSISGICGSPSAIKKLEKYCVKKKYQIEYETYKGYKIIMKGDSDDNN